MGVFLPNRRASKVCFTTFLESILTPLLLLWSCYVQYGVILPTTLNGLSSSDDSQPAPYSSTSTVPMELANRPKSFIEAAVALPIPTAAKVKEFALGEEQEGEESEAEKDALLWARAPIVFAILLSSIYGVLFLMSISHYIRTLLVDNCPEAHPYDVEAARNAAEREDASILTEGDRESPRATPEATAGEEKGEKEKSADEGPFERCNKCHGTKPKRCHHCSRCNRCCLKMDHHCLFSI